VILTLAASSLTCGLALVGPTSRLLGISLFIAVNLTYNVALFIYDSYLKLITDEHHRGLVSGFGWGLGYVGGIVCLAITFPFFSQEPTVGGTLGFRSGFIIVGLFYLLFSLPALRFMPGVVGAPRLGGQNGSILRESWRAARATVTHWRDHREVFKFLVAFFCITEGIMTIIYFTANYLSTTFGLGTRDILLFTVIVQLFAFPTTWLAGRIGDRWSVKWALLASIVVWLIIVLLMAFGRAYGLLYVISSLIGLVIGSSQALGRAFLASLTPTEKVSELFGFNSLSSKVAATIGPGVFGGVATALGSQRLAWLSVIPFFLVGASILVRVQEPKRSVTACEGGFRPPREDQVASP
jgi:UMF1 family MFS transporter